MNDTDYNEFGFRESHWNFRPMDCTVRYYPESHYRKANDFLSLVKRENRYKDDYFNSFTREFEIYYEDKNMVANLSKNG